MSNIKYSLQSSISNLDYKLTLLRSEVMETIKTVFDTTKKSEFSIEDDQPLASHSGNSFAVSTVEFNPSDDDDKETQIYVRGMNDDGNEYSSPIDELDTDVLVQVANKLIELM